MEHQDPLQVYFKSMFIFTLAKKSRDCRIESICTSCIPTLSLFLVGDSPRIKKALNDVSVPLGMQTTLKCTFDNGGLDVDVKWYRGNKELSKSKRHSMSQTPRDATLTIKDLQSSDAAQFTCVISNPLGQIDSTCKITVSGE